MQIFKIKSGPENLPKSFRCLLQSISVIKKEFKIYLSKHSSNTYFCSPNNHQYGSPLVSHVQDFITSFLSALTLKPLIMSIFIFYISNKLNVLKSNLKESGYDSEKTAPLTDGTTHVSTHHTHPKLGRIFNATACSVNQP